MNLRRKDAKTQRRDESGCRDGAFTGQQSVELGRLEWAFPSITLRLRTFAPLR